MLRWPGKIRPAEFDVPISSVDLVPTILAATGIEPPQELPGTNLLPLVQNGESLQRGPVFGEIFGHDGPNLDRPADGLQYRWCVDGHWKLIVPAKGALPVELYNLQSDPHETQNVAADHPEEAQRLNRQLDAWWKT
jgi:uncharacterized sulfatase